MNKQLDVVWSLISIFHISTKLSHFSLLLSKVGKLCVCSHPTMTCLHDALKKLNGRKIKNNNNNNKNHCAGIQREKKQDFNQ